MSQQKKEEMIWCQNQIIVSQSFPQNMFSILQFSKILIDEFWCDYVKPRYAEKAELCYMDTDVSLYA